MMLSTNSSMTTVVLLLGAIAIVSAYNVHTKDPILTVTDVYKQITPHKSWFVFVYKADCGRSAMTIDNIQTAAETLKKYGIETAGVEFLSTEWEYTKVDNQLQMFPGVYMYAEDGTKAIYQDHADPVQAEPEEFVRFAIKNRHTADPTKYKIYQNNHVGPAIGYSTPAPTTQRLQYTTAAAPTTTRTTQRPYVQYTTTHAATRRPYVPTTTVHPVYRTPMADKLPVDNEEDLSDPKKFDYSYHPKDNSKPTVWLLPKKDVYGKTAYSIPWQKHN